MPLSRRYTPEWSPGDAGTIGMSFEYILPPGVGIVADGTDGTGGPVPRLEIWTNVSEPTRQGGWNVASTNPLPDWALLPIDNGNSQNVAVSGRSVYVRAAGGTAGIDYQFRWTIVDTDQNLWHRTALLLCGLTS